MQDKFVPAGIIKPFENAKSLTATHCMATDDLDCERSSGRLVYEMGQTGSEPIVPLAFAEEAVNFAYLVHHKLHPAICSYNGLNFFSKSRDELWIGCEVIQSLSNALMAQLSMLCWSGAVRDTHHG